MISTFAIFLFLFSQQEAEPVERRVSNQGGEGEYCDDENSQASMIENNEQQILVMSVNS